MTQTPKSSRACSVRRDSILNRNPAAHRSRVAGRAHNARHCAKGPLVDEGHDGVRGPLRHLHKEAEHQHGENGKRQDRHLRERDEGNPLQQQNAAQEHGAALEAEEPPGPVAERAAHGPGEEVP